MRVVRALAWCVAMVGLLSHGWVSASWGAAAGKIYVALGFHANFYHSWRGDTPDEAGFGTDIRVVRGILSILDEANARGLDARGYWDFDGLFTLESILPRYAPDIIAAVRRRVQDGLDEVILAPYDNGMFSAMTEAEMRFNLRAAVSNPWGSGVQDLFGRYTPFLRPQEYMFTTGSIPLLEAEGIRGVVLAYSNYPFTAFSNFVPALPAQQRLGLLWLQTEEGGARTVLLPAVSIGDILNFGSFERWLLELRRLQTTGQVQGDLLLHVNFDADAETWLPIPMPRLLRWLPNTGGLREYIEVVNRYDWVSFTTLGEYAATHAPVGTVVVRQDMADGAWDGQYSWAEKWPSQWLWTQIEHSRLAEKRALALARTTDPETRQRIEQRLFDGRESAFFDRIRALSTTHFGMSTPLVNEERQAKAETIATRAARVAREAERIAAEEVRARTTVPDECTYGLVVADLRRDGSVADALVRVPVWLAHRPAGVWAHTLPGGRVEAALVDVEDVPHFGVRAELWLRLSLAPSARELVCVRFDPGSPEEEAARTNEQQPTEQHGVEFTLQSDGRPEGLAVAGIAVGGNDFVAPFVTYRVHGTPRRFDARWQRVPASTAEVRPSLWRERARAVVRFPVENDEAATDIEVTWSRFAHAPWIVADVTVKYPYTPKRDLLSGLQQKLRRLVDLRWVEVAPFPLHPLLRGSRERPLRIWKRNWLGVVSSYDLDYGRINPANASLDAFNHQVTAGWVAVAGEGAGLLVGYNADWWASPAFAPMRLREESGRQLLWLNPFGSYHGRQMDYAHLGGSGIASEVAARAGAQFRPNGPSFNGQTQRFSLLLAPYVGDAPPQELQATAEAFFHPPAVVYVRTPVGSEVLVREDLERWLVAQSAEASTPLPPEPPPAFLVNPTEQAAHLVWDPPRGVKAQFYEAAWRKAGTEAWTTERVDTPRLAIEGLENEVEYEFRVRAVGYGGEAGEWTPVQRVRIGPVRGTGFGREARSLDWKLVVRLFFHSARAAVAAWMQR